MKRFLVCSQLMLVILFLLQSTKPLQNSVNSLEYSVEERIYIVQKSLVRDDQQQQHDTSQEHGALNVNNIPPGSERAQHHHGQLHQHHLHHHNHHHPQQNQQQIQQHQLLHGQHPYLTNKDFQNQQQQQHIDLQPNHHQQYHDAQNNHENFYQQANIDDRLNQQYQQQGQPRQKSIANSMQQVLLDAVVSNQQNHQYQYTQLQWKHETSQRGQLSEFYYNTIESSSLPHIAHHHHDHLAYYHQYNRLSQQQQPHDPAQDHHQRYLHEQHILFSDANSNEETYIYGDALNVVAQTKRTQLNSQSCDSQHYESSSILMQNQYAIQEPTCKASHVTSSNHNHQDDNLPNFSQYNNKQSHNSNVESFPLTTQQYHYESSLLAAIRHYWREVSGLCLASAIFLNWLFVVIKRRFVSSGLTRAEHALETIKQATTSSSTTTTTNNNTRSVSKDTNSSIHDSAFEEIACPISLEDIDNSKSSHSTHKTSLLNNVKKSSLNISTNIRQRSSTLKGDAKNSSTTTIIPSEPIPIPINNNNNKAINTINNLSSSPIHTSISTSFTNSPNNSEYNSRYSSDFDSIQRLGRGGFGVVFEARNKIDDCHYAVKRICLPLEKEARERVMREVRALAKLDHAGIVRYYNAWLETPPDEWLKQHDAQLGINNSKDGMSYPSTDGIYDRNESELHTRGDQLFNDYNGKLCGAYQSGDNLSGLYGQHNAFNRRRRIGMNRFLRNNSSSPSLDIVFEGSGSIRLESENNTEKTNSSSSQDDLTGYDNNGTIKSKENNHGDNNTNSDSEEDSDFIQFESKVNNSTIEDITTSGNSLNTNVCDNDYSTASHLTDPFSSSGSSSGECDEVQNDKKQQGYSRKDNITIKSTANNRIDLRRNALNHQKELRQFNSTSLVENIHVEKVYLYIQMQLCRKDTLKDWLKTNCENRDKTTIFDLFYQIVDAVEYVHSQDLIHRDLKPSNIFFSLDGTLKIGDFGLCRAKTSTGIGSSLDLQEYVAESDVEKGFEAVHTEQVGTQLYMSPEQLNGLSYNQKVDIFAMGLILLELLVPFKTQMQRVNVLFKARNNLYSDQFKIEHPHEHELVKSLLSRSPQKRPTASEIKQHELLANAQLSQPVIERIYHRRRTISSNSSTE